MPPEYTQPQPEQTPIPPEEHRSNLWLAAMLAILVIAAGVSLFWYFKNCATCNAPAEQEEVLLVEDEISMSQQAVGSPTDEWQTYRNEEYGFEFKYPENFYLHSEYENYIPGGGPLETIIGNNVAIYVFINNSSSVSKGAGVLEIELAPGKILSLQFDSEIDQTALMNQILSTFRFTN